MSLDLPRKYSKQRTYRYSLYHQKQLVLLAKQTGVSASQVCKDYNVPKSTLRNWIKKIDLDIEYSKNDYTMHPGKPATGMHLDHMLFEHIEEMEQGMSECTVDSLIIKVIRYDAEFMEGDVVKIRPWMYRFIHRNDFSIRLKTHVAQKICADDKCLDYVMYANRVQENFGIHPDFIINMDETPVYNDNRPATKIVSTGASSVNGSRTRTGDYRSTVILACTLSGKKLQPMIIYKAAAGKSVEKGFTPQKGFPITAQYCCQAKAWNDESTMLRWIDKVSNH